MNKRGQVTVFIIIGLVVIGAIILYYFLQNTEQNVVLETEIPGQAESNIQREVRVFMDSCIREATYHGLEILRLQGGHINIPSNVRTTSFKNDENKEIILQNGIKKVIIDENHDGNELAYWLDSNNNLAIPSTLYMETQLEEYIELSMLKCINNFEAFTDYEVETDTLTATVTFSDEVLTEINYPITFTRNDLLFSEEEFILRIPINMKKMGDIGTELTLSEYFGFFLEYDIMNLINLYGYAGNDGLPPISFVEVGQTSVQKTWHLSQVRSDLSKNFIQNFQYITIEGFGNNAPLTNNEVSQGVYDSLTHDAVDQAYPFTEIDIFFNPDAEFFLDIQPRQGSTLKPFRVLGKGLKLLSTFINTKYQFKYTLKFPTFFKLTDKESKAIDIVKLEQFKVKDFEFIIPLGVNICGNQKRECTGPNPFTDEIDFNSETQSFFCSSKRSLPYSFTLENAYTNEKIDNADLYYQCGTSQDDCLIGNSKDGELKSKLPLCINGFLHIEKEGYSPSKELLTTQTGLDEQQRTIRVYPYSEIDFDFKIVRLPQFFESYIASETFTETACEDFKSNFEDLAIQPTNMQAILFSDYGPSDIIANNDETSIIKAAPGKYAFSTIINGEVKIPCVTVEDRPVCATPTFTEYNGDWPLGSYTDFQTTFTETELRNANKITFYGMIEYRSNTFTLLNLPDIIQDNGDLKYTANFDHDCNATTPNYFQTLTIPKEKVEEYFRPKLE